MSFYRRRKPAARRPADVIAAEKAAKLALSMTCQCCGRDVFAETGVIAHHGYERPGEGWQTASCWGARQLPFEVNRDRLGKLLEHMREQHANITKYRDDVVNDEASFIWTFTDKTKPRDNRGRRGTTTCTVTREAFDACYAIYLEVREHRQSPEPTFLGLKANKITELGQSIQRLADTITVQQARYDGWTQTHRRGEKGESIWMPLEPVDDGEGWQI